MLAKNIGQSIAMDQIDCLKTVGEKTRDEF